MSIRSAPPIPLTISILGVLLLTADAAATTYYVRKTGNDANPGTSPRQAWATISKAAATMTAGDVTCVGAGTYREGVVLRQDGTASKPIRLIADISGSATGDAGPVEVAPGKLIRRIASPLDADGLGAIPAPITEKKVSFIIDGDYVEVVGFRIFGATNGVTWLSGVGTLLQNCEIDRHSKAGLLLLKSGIQTTLVNCDVHHNTWDGIQLNNGGRISASRCCVRDNGRCGANFGATDATSVSLSACLVYANRRDGIRMDAGDGTITNCLIYDNADNGVYRSGTSAGKSLTLWNSTIASNAGNGILQYGGELNVTNSIIANNRAYGIRHGSGTLTHTYNLLFGNSDGDYQSVTADPTELSDDPRFANRSVFDYHLSDGSPAIDAGTDADGTVDDDLEGNPRPRGRGWDLGCYEMPEAAGASSGWRVRTWIEIDKPGS